MARHRLTALGQVGPRSPSATRRHTLVLAVVVVTPFAVLAGPLAFILALVFDLAEATRSRRSRMRSDWRPRMRWSRLLGMAVTYLMLEFAGIAIAAGLWVVSGFGHYMHRDWSRRMHYRVQRWWAKKMLGSIKRWLRLEFTCDDSPGLGSAPVIIASRHSSFIDALLPTIMLARESDESARHVLKRELAWDPCLGLYGHRHPNHFVARGAGDPQAELEALERLAATADTEALVIFPEGTFHSPERAARVRARLAVDDPQRHARLQLDHLLPVRPGGVLALLRGRPSSDLVFLGHTGFEPFGSFRQIVANVPFCEPVRVRTWRVDRADIPSDPAAQLEMIDSQWQVMDRWIGSKKS